MGTDILYAVDQGVATITFNRPQRMNAISPAMLDLFFARVADAAAEPEARAIVVTGNGNAFSAGIDLSLVGDMAEITTVPGTPTPTSRSRNGATASDQRWSVISAPAEAA